MKVWEKIRGGAVWILFFAVLAVLSSCGKSPEPAAVVPESIPVEEEAEAVVTSAPSPTPEPTATPAPSPTPESSPTPEPTATPTPVPTPTPEPTATPTPVPTSTPTPTPEPEPEPETIPVAETPAVVPEERETTDLYVLNTRSKKIHNPWCGSVPRISPENYATSSLSIAELEAQGYEKCRQKGDW